MVGLDCQKNTVGRFYGLPLNIRKNPAKGLPFALGQGGVNVGKKAQDNGWQYCGGPCGICLYGSRGNLSHYPILCDGRAVG